MNCCFGLSEQDVEITKTLKDARKSYTNDIRILLLGAAHSGKTTIYKLLKIIHDQGFSDREKQTIKEIIILNINTFLNKVLNTNVFLNNLTPELQEISKEVREKLRSTKQITPDLAVQIYEWWHSPNIKQLCEVETSTICSAYLLDSIKRIAHGDYVPTEQDALYARFTTTGISELKFQYNERNITVTDVGGQRSERRKWIHLFSDVNTIIYCVALPEFDLQLDEAPDCNRMIESLELFTIILRTEELLHVPVIIFFNKNDLFMEKIKHKDLRTAFPQYTGGNNYQQALQYLVDQFMQRLAESKEAEPASPKKGIQRVISTHVITAADIKSMENVFSEVLRTIMRPYLNSEEVL